MRYGSDENMLIFVLKTVAVTNNGYLGRIRFVSMALLAVDSVNLLLAVDFKSDTRPWPS